ncbi:hypothetical protein H6G65_03540 [Microcystis elabens FACHB-917]|nr:hypothetical protein [Microcystis elabens FACHB-917]
MAEFQRWITPLRRYGVEPLPTGALKTTPEKLRLERRILLASVERRCNDQGEAVAHPRPASSAQGLAVPGSVLRIHGL